MTQGQGIEGYVCIVTGCNSIQGIGRSAVYALAKKGVRAIYVTDICSNNLQSLADDVQKSTGVECIPKRVDASSDQDLQELISDALAKFERLDVFFANAAKIMGGRPLELETKEGFLEMMGINAWSVFAGIKYASEAMKKTSSTKPESGGSIIATASISGIKNGNGPTTYGASKAAIINICQAASWKLGGDNIRVNAVCPGPINTGLQLKKPDPETLEMYKQVFKTYVPLKRIGHPTEIGNTVAFLASPDASFITGQAIAVDGGITASVGFPSTSAEY